MQELQEQPEAYLHRRAVRRAVIRDLSFSILETQCSAMQGMLRFAAVPAIRELEVMSASLLETRVATMETVVPSLYRRGDSRAPGAEAGAE